MLLVETEIFEGTLDQHIFKGCVILGEQSKNGWQYPEAVRRASAPLYEQANVYLNHKEDNPLDRSVQEHVGVMRNIFCEKKTFGDLHLDPHGTLTESIKWKIANCKNFGLSHSVDADFDDKKVVHRINRVYSVDLVVNPSTTKNLFEQEKLVIVEKDKLLKEQEGFIKQLTDDLNLSKKDVEVLKAKICEVESLVKTLSAEKPVAILPVEIESPRKNINSYDAWLKRLKG